MDRKYFFVSMACSLLLLLLIVGISIVEKNTQTIISGEAPSFIKFDNTGVEPKRFQIRFMGQDFVFDF